jgi:hypothetical protein
MTTRKLPRNESEVAMHDRLRYAAARDGSARLVAASNEMLAKRAVALFITNFWGRA